MFLKKIVFFLLAASLFFAGCLNNFGNGLAIEQNNAYASPNYPGSAGEKLVLDVSSLALTPDDLQFDSSEYKQLNTPVEAFGQGDAAAFFASFGYKNGFQVTMLKIDADKNSLKKLVQQASVYDGAEGAKKAFASLKQTILESERGLAQLAVQGLAQLAVQGLAEESFGVSATRTLEAKGGNLAVSDYVLVFRKGNAVEAIDFLGEEQAVSEKEALEIGGKAVAKIA